MKFILRCLLAALAISAIEAPAAQQPAAGLLVYESVTNYVEVFEFVSIARKNLFDSTIIRPTGQSLSCKTEYIRAVVNYPPLFISPENAAAASDNIRNIESLQERYPKFKGQFQTVEAKWNTAVEAGKQMKLKEPVAQNPSTKAESFSFTTTDGKKYENVTISGTSGTDISVVSDRGIEHVLFEQLPRDMQIRFHYVPQTVVAQDRRDKDALAQQVKDAQSQRAKEAQARQDMEAQTQPGNQGQVEKGQESQAEIPENSARIGSPLKEFINRYGNPSFQKANPPYDQVVLFSNKDYKIYVAIIDGLACGVQYFNSEIYRNLTKQEIAIILKKNDGGAGWMDNENPLMEDYKFVRKDNKAYARVLPPDPFGTIATGINVQFVSGKAIEYISNIKAAEIDKSKRAQEERKRKEEEEKRQEGEYKRQTEEKLRQKAEGL